jgi:hypothetical protein
MSTTTHAVLSASSSKRWLTCTPSARLEQTLPEPKKLPGQFDFSLEGTLAHSLAEIKLRLHYNQIPQKDYDEEVAELYKHAYYNQELESHVDNYVLYVRSQVGEHDKPLFEQRVDFSDWVPDGFGTADVVILSKHSIRIIDLKYGRGVPVQAKDNTQLRLYALGTYSKFQEEYPEIKTIEYTIYQPRLDSISTDGTTIAKLVDWANYYVKQKARKAWAGTGDFIPGEHCQFCRAKAACKARSDFVNEIAALDFRPAPLLTEEEFDLVLSRAQDLKSWANDVEAYATEKAIHENKIPTGFKLVVPKGHRKIVDYDLAVKILEEKGFNKDDMYELKPKSVPQLEKLGQKGQVVSILGGLVERPDGSPKLVKDTTLEEDFK